jgi:hypothetical protein
MRQWLLQPVGRNCLDAAQHKRLCLLFSPVYEQAGRSKRRQRCALHQLAFQASFVPPVGDQHHWPLIGALDRAEPASIRVGPEGGVDGWQMRVRPFAPRSDRNRTLLRRARIVDDYVREVVVTNGSMSPRAEEAFARGRAVLARLADDALTDDMGAALLHIAEGLSPAGTVSEDTWSRVYWQAAGRGPGGANIVVRHCFNGGWTLTRDGMADVVMLAEFVEGNLGPGDPSLTWIHVATDRAYHLIGRDVVITSNWDEAPFDPNVVYSPA